MLPVCARRMQTAAFEEMVAFQRALKQLVEMADPNYGKREEFYIALEGR